MKRKGLKENLIMVYSIAARWTAIEVPKTALWDKIYIELLNGYLLVCNLHLDGQVFVTSS